MFLDLRETTKNPVVRAYASFRRERAELDAAVDIFARFTAPLLLRLATLPSWGDVQSLGTVGKHLDLYLRKQDSALPREIALAFEVKGIKRGMSESLYVHFELYGNGSEHMTLDVNGYVPASCHIVETEELVPARIEKVRRVVCSDDEEPRG